MKKDPLIQVRMVPIDRPHPRWSKPSALILLLPGGQESTQNTRVHGTGCSSPLGAALEDTTSTLSQPVPWYLSGLQMGACGVGHPLLPVPISS